MAPSVHATGPGGAYSIAGSMSYENLFLINGVTVSENLRGQPYDLYIEDAIQETTVATAGISAEYGRFGGGVVNVVTKSGGNLFSGSLRDTLNNDNWRALSPFTGDSKLDKVLPAYEYTLGGPVLKDHLWFFAAGRRQSLDERRTLAVTAAFVPFNIALSCGEVWTGRVVRGANGLPLLQSESPIVTSFSGNFGAGGTVKTTLAFAGTSTKGGFSIAGNAPNNVTPDDTTRGYAEVIGIADLPCEPVDKDGNPVKVDTVNGNTWNVYPGTFMATNALAAEAILVRSASGVSFGYPFDAISRFRPVFFGVANGAGGAAGYFQAPTTIGLGQIFGNDTPIITMNRQAAAKLRSLNSSKRTNGSSVVSECAKK
jgi:hypothetical protein